MLSWWNGRHVGLKNRSPERGVKVRVLLGVPFIFALACATVTSPAPPASRNVIGGDCEKVSKTPNTDSEWSSSCYCALTDNQFNQCIDGWVKWHDSNSGD